ILSANGLSTAAVRCIPAGAAAQTSLALSSSYADGIRTGGPDTSAPGLDPQKKLGLTLGGGAIAEWSSGVAIGDNAGSFGNRAIAMGDTAESTEEDSIAIGFHASASQGAAIAIGLQTK